MPTTALDGSQDPADTEAQVQFGCSARVCIERIHEQWVSHFVQITRAKVKPSRPPFALNRKIFQVRHLLRVQRVHENMQARGGMLVLLASTFVQNWQEGIRFFQS